MFELRSVCRTYTARQGAFDRARDLRAVAGVDLSVRLGETLALVGESGCGKSTLARLLLRLEKPSSGSIAYRGTDLWKMDRQGVRGFRRDVQMVFQDPYASLNPRMRVGQIIGEGLTIHRLARGRDLEARVAELLLQVGLPEECLANYPYEFSGGQRQRIGIARALAVDPKVIVADEPVSALDVSIQAQVLNLLQDLKEERGLTYLFISHDLRVVEHIADRVAVMYLGAIVESGESAELFSAPLHPYTEALLAAVPVPDPDISNRGSVLAGDVPDPLDPPGGCSFHPRCPRAFDPCGTVVPAPRKQAGGRWVACHLYR